MKVLKSILLAGVLAVTALPAFSATITNQQTLGSGPLTLPATLNYGQSFSAASGANVGDVFFDAYFFTIPAGTANSVTTSIDLAGILGLSNLSARIYSGATNDITNSVTALEGWSPAVNTALSSGVTLQTVVLNPITLLAGTYTLQIKGSVSGALGGSYAGVMNIATPVPETESYAMLLTGLGFMGAIARRRKTS